MAKLKRESHGVDLGPLQPCMPGRLPFRRGGAAPRIDLAPEAMIDDLARLEASEHDNTGPQLQLIGRRQLRSNNSWMHNVPKLMAGKPRCTLRMHADDAQRLGIRDGQNVEITSRVGTITAPVELGDELMPGVVSLPHGFGHHRRGTRLGVASERAGVSINDLTDDQRTDGLSGVAAFSGVPVTVSPV
jgi:anaerobic selenocysteine-containing dehydrogenase